MPITSEVDKATMRNPPVLAIIVPCYDEESVVAETARRLTRVLDELTTDSEITDKSFIYFVDDGSRDGTWRRIDHLHADDKRIKGLRLSRNVGTQHALLAGLLGVADHVDCAVTIDADLQQDEAAIRAFIEKYRAGAEIVYGVRHDRDADSVLRRFTGSFFYKFMRLMGVRIVSDHSDYRLLSRRSIQAVARYEERNLFLRGVVADIGFRSEVVHFRVRKRPVGASRYSLMRLVSLALDGITSFSIVPLRIVTFVGIAVFVWSALMSLYVLWHVWRGDTIPGWAGITIPIYFLGGVQIIMTGLVGEYIGRIYKEVKARPRFIKDSELF